MKNKASNDSFAQGAERRKRFPDAEVARWDTALRKQSPLETLHRAEQGRIAPLLALKHERMSTSPFLFFRGAAALMASDLALTENSEIRTQLCGDAHVQNLGAYTGVDGRLIFDINDFDETYPGPFEWDVKRMAVSILLAGRSASVKRGDCVRAAESFLTSYCCLLEELALLPVLEAARYQVHRLSGVKSISKIFRKAERSTPLRTLDRLTTPTKQGVRFRSEPPLLERVEGEQAEMVLASLVEYATKLQPERRHFFRQFRPMDVAFKVVGTGSIGLRDYCVYMQGNGPEDPLFLQIKQEAESVYAPYLPAATPADNQGQRVVEGQRAMQIQSDPLLGWTTLNGQDYLVRQLNDHKAAIDVTELDGAGLAEYGKVCGEMLARGHARSGDIHRICGFLGEGKRFKTAALQFAEAYADQTEQDWKDFVSKLKRL